MAKKTKYCPFMTIGFEAPKKGEKDNRICMTDCMWYNPAEEQCHIVTISERLEMMQSLMDDMAYYAGGYASESFGPDENEEYYKGRTG